MIPDHPDLTAINNTGYPHWMQPKKDEPIYCDECGKELDWTEVYDDNHHDYLCKECLLYYHKKELWY